MLRIAEANCLYCREYCHRKPFVLNSSVPWFIAVVSLRLDMFRLQKVTTNVKDNLNKMERIQRQYASLELADRKALETSFEMINFWSMVHLVVMVFALLVQVLYRSRYSAYLSLLCPRIFWRGANFVSLNSVNWKFSCYAALCSHVGDSVVWEPWAWWKLLFRERMKLFSFTRHHSRVPEKLPIREIGTICALASRWPTTQPGNFFYIWPIIFASCQQKVK